MFVVNWATGLASVATVASQRTDGRMEKGKAKAKVETSTSSRRRVNQKEEKEKEKGEQPRMTQWVLPPIEK